LSVAKFNADVATVHRNVPQIPAACDLLIRFEASIVPAWTTENQSTAGRFCNSCDRSCGHQQTVWDWNEFRATFDGAILPAPVGFSKRPSGQPQIVVSATIDRATISLDSRRRCRWKLAKDYAIAASEPDQAQPLTAHLFRWIQLAAKAGSRRYGRVAER